MVMRLFGFIFLLIFLFGVLGAGGAQSKESTMESLLKEQIAEQRYQQMKAQRQNKKPMKQAQKKSMVYKSPPHKITLIVGSGKKFAAHLVVPNASKSASKAVFVVRAGDRLEYENMRFSVIRVNERCVILKRGARRYEISFITP